MNCLTNSMEKNPPSEANGPHLVQKCPAFNRI